MCEIDRFLIKFYIDLFAILAKFARKLSRATPYMIS